MDDKSSANRFVCPNDRQLALRAKLRTGWSVKTATFSCPGNGQPVAQQPLDAEEQAAIIDVIRRAELLDLSEQERVGKLVDRLEHMRHSVLGRNSHQCLLCGDIFGILSAQKQMCIDCQHPVCSRCSTAASDNPNRFRCMICAETREIWKKSGAWFFHTLPRYRLASDGSHRNNNRRGTKVVYDDSSSDDERSAWRKVTVTGRRNSSTESTHDTLDGQKDSSMSHYEASVMAVSTSTASKMDDDTISLKLTEENSRRESMASRSEWNWSEESRMSPSCSSITSSCYKNPPEEVLQKLADAPLGIIELSLTYNPLASTLQCTVYRAKNLTPMDINGLADPFCKLNILPSTKTSTRLRTKTVHKTRNPEFNEHLTFYDVSETDLAAKSLHVLVVDDDRFGHDYMGETRVVLAKMRQQNTIYVTAPLEKLRSEQRGPGVLPELNEWFDDLCSRGQILLTLCYSTKKRALLVMVNKCANLLPMDNNGFSDPFVKLQLRPDPNHRKHKTSIKWKNLNPVFNEEFAFESRPTDLATQSLYITVYDKDYGKSNDYLGGLILGGTGSKGLRLKQWLDMIRYPDHRHEAWHNLTEETLN